MIYFLTFLEMSQSDTTSPKFDPAQIEEFFGSQSMCYFCGVKRAVDPNHTLKKLPPKGYKKVIMSSMYNLSPLCRDCHTNAPIHRKNKALLSKTETHLNVMGFMPEVKDILFKEAHSRFYD